MKVEHAGETYYTVYEENKVDGFVGCDLVCIMNNDVRVVAQIRYWDANGQLMLETINFDVPVEIIEEFIREAKATLVY
jgi:hypothetical protein